MLLEAAFISLFFAPRGLRPGLGAARSAVAASLFLLRWEWFRIYFESGVVKLAQRRAAVAQPHRDGPVLPERAAPDLDRLVRAAASRMSFHAATVVLTLVVELGARLDGVPAAPLPRIACFCIVTAFQIGDHPHRQLRLPELSGAGPRRAAARRPRSSRGSGCRSRPARRRRRGRARWRPARRRGCGARLGLLLDGRRLRRRRGPARPLLLARHRARAVPHRQRATASSR